MHAYFGQYDWVPNVPGFKSRGGALEVRRRVQLAAERAEVAPA